MAEGGANRLDRIELWTVIEGAEYSALVETGLGVSVIFIVIIAAALWWSPVGVGVASSCMGGTTDTGVKKGRGFDGLAVGEEEEGVASCWANAMLCTALWAAGVCTEFIPAQGEGGEEGMKEGGGRE